MKEISAFTKGYYPLGIDAPFSTSNDGASNFVTISIFLRNGAQIAYFDGMVE